MFTLPLKLIEQSEACVCSCWQSEKHLGAGAAIITGKNVCVLHAARIALRAVAEQLLQSIQIREGPLSSVCVSV